MPCYVLACCLFDNEKRPRLHEPDIQPEIGDTSTQPIGKKNLVRRAICSRIVEGIYRKGEKIPSCREIAVQLKVSKNSAYEAYTGLVGLGILESRNRSGFTVGMDIPDVEIHKFAYLDAEHQDNKAPKKRIIGSNLPDINTRASQPKNWTEFEFPFVYNQIDTELFPIEAWRECSRLALEIGRAHV